MRRNRSAGNRTAQTATITSTQVTNYVYDAANRLTSVNGQAYTWDDNGNLLNDGTTQYAYDQANRLTVVSGQSSVVTYAYNGDGARLKQVVNGAVTTYTLDLVAPLVQVLVAKDSGGDTRYLYGVTRIGEQQSAINNPQSPSWVYHVSDALGSVRQIADANGSITLAKSYEPYGSVLNSTGSASSIFAYVGEEFDTTRLIYLRARYMQPRWGIFLSEDTVPGIASLPQSVHLFAYTWNNPINRVDPSGQQQPPPKCDFGEICSTGPIGPYVRPIPPVEFQYVPNPPPPELLRLPTGFVSGFSATADLAPWGIHTTDVRIGKQVQCGNGVVGGEETVWDYRHLQKARFKYFGITQDLGSLFGGWPAQFYTGLVFGFKDSIREYSGWFKTNELGVGVPGITIGGMWAVGLDNNGNEPPDAVRANYGIISLGAGVGAPAGGGTSYTYYQLVTNIFGVQPRQSISRAQRGVLAEWFALDIENTAPFDQTARIAADLARTWGQYDPE